MLPVERNAGVREIRRTKNNGDFKAFFGEK